MPRIAIGILATCILMVPSAAVADEFEFIIDQNTSGAKNMSFAADASLSGNLIGNWDAATNPNGTRTKPGLFGSFGSSENVSVDGIALSPKTSGVLNTHSDGMFRMSIDAAAGTIQITNLTSNLLASGPVAFPASTSFTVPAFRTRSPDSTYIPATANVPLGDANVTSAIANQVGVAVGSIDLIGPGHYSFKANPLVTVTSHVDFGDDSIDNTTAPVSMPISGEITINGDSANVTASTTFAVDQTEMPATALEPYPYNLPTVLPPGNTAHVILSLTLDKTHVKASGPADLNAGGVRSQWGVDGGGTWGDAKNWIGSLPDGPGATANFLGKLQSVNFSATVALDGDRTVGKLVFDNFNTYFLAPGSGGTLFINNNGQQATIQVVKGSQAIRAPLTLVDSATADIATGSELAFAGLFTISSGKSLTKNGGGMLRIAAPMNLGNGTTIAAMEGSIRLHGFSPSAIGDNVLFTIDHGAELIASESFDPFTDALAPTRHAAIQNEGALAILNGHMSVESITGKGTITIGEGSDTGLSAKFIRGDALTLRANARMNVSGDGTTVSRLLGVNIDGSIDNWHGKLDLGSSDLILQADSATALAVLDTISNQIKTARGSGGSLWQGNGVTSSAAAGDAKGITGLAAIRNINTKGKPIYVTFDGEPVDANSILVKYTYNGDADLNGAIDANDYFQIDSGFIAGLTGYRNGDFDYNGTIDADDYFQIDSAFTNQTAVLGGGAFASATAVPECSSIALLSVFFGSLGMRRRGRNISI